MTETTQAQPGAHSAMHSWHASRSAAAQAAFFIPHLRGDIRLLDLGCGPGAITMDLAELVAPGRVVGMDIDAERVHAARALAAERGQSNVTFLAGDVHVLPFADASFDAVFEHAVFMHLQQPARAASEAFRVLTPGGCFGGRDADHDGWLWSPPEMPIYQEWFALARQFLSVKGSNYFFGRQLASVLNGAGFIDLIPSAAYQMFNTAEARAAWVHIQEGVCADPGMEAFARANGYQFAARAPAAMDEIRAWAAQPCAFLAQSQCEVVAWKPTRE